MNNLFPTAREDAPDLVDEEPPRAAAPGFPQAPAAAAFSKGIADDLREISAEMGATGTKVERAIAFLRQHGPATNEQLADHLHVKKDSVSAYIQSAIKDGRIVRDGKQLKAGDGAPAVRAKPGPKPASAPKTKPEADATPRAQKVAGSDAKVCASLCVGELQIIAWATGNLTVRANDNVVDLSDTQTLALHAFLELAR